MMIQDDVQAKILDFVLQEFPAARKRGITETDLLLEQGVIDSMGILEIVSFLEQRFSIQLTDDEMLADHFDSVRSMADLVRGKLGGDR